MGRRRQSLLEDIIGITARFPWWVGVLLAAVSYVGLHWLASSKSSVAPKDLQNLTGSLGKQLAVALATVLQYVLPLVFLVGSVASIFARRKRNGLYTKVVRADNALHDMTWQDFELLVGEYFRRRGFKVTETGGAGPDGGVDLIAATGTDRYVVQCKKWKAQQVGVQTVRELYGVMTAVGAAGAFVVTSGTFTKEAGRFAEGREIELVSADYLLSEMRKERAAEASAAALPEANTPACPECGMQMVMRTARKGPDAGSPFWGCSTFPKCRGTRQALFER
jgi:restriction system protein